MKNNIIHISLVALLMSMIQAPLPSLPEAPFIPFTVSWVIGKVYSDFTVENEAGLENLSEILSSQCTPTSNLWITFEGGGVDDCTFLQFRQKFLTPEQEPPLPPPAHAPWDIAHASLHGSQATSSSSAGPSSRPWLPDTFHMKLDYYGRISDDPKTSKYEAYMPGASVKVTYDRSTGKKDEMKTITGSWNNLTDLLKDLQRYKIHSVSVKFKRGPIRYMSHVGSNKLFFSNTRIYYKPLPDRGWLLECLSSLALFCS